LVQKSPGRYAEDKTDCKLSVPAALSEEKVRAIVKVGLEYNKCAEVVQKQLENKRMTVNLSSIKRTRS